MPHFIPRLLGLSGLILAALPALAADADKQIATAAAHAGMAVGAEDPQMVRAHLHHVLNCLEGPDGADFAAAAGNPCKDMGKGAITDSVPAARKSLEQAAALARQGLAEMEISRAKVKASEAQAILGK